MKLLSTRNTISIVEFYGRDIPPYAILSHTWTDGEILLQELQDQEVANLEWEQVDDLHAQAQVREGSGAGPEIGLQNVSPSISHPVFAKKGFFKLQRTAALARSEGFDFVWVDTCCIDKTSSAELSEAINSMYRWYQGAQVCYAYLEDVNPARTEDPLAAGSSFRRSRWFTRGWTLQELIAPSPGRFLCPRLELSGQP